MITGCTGPCSKQRRTMSTWFKPHTQNKKQHRAHVTMTEYTHTNCVIYNNDNDNNDNDNEKNSLLVEVDASTVLQHSGEGRAVDLEHVEQLHHARVLHVSASTVRDERCKGLGVKGMCECRVMAEYKSGG